MTLSNDDLYDKIVGPSSNVADNFLELAHALRQLLDRDSDLFMRAISKSGIGRRKAYYLVNIDRWFGDIPGPKARLRDLGWSKLQIIGPHVDSHNLDHLLELAEKNTDAQLLAIVKGDEPLGNARSLLKYFNPKQYAELEGLLSNSGTSRTDDQFKEGASGSRPNWKSGGQFWTPIPRFRGSLFHAGSQTIIAVSTIVQTFRALPVAAAIMELTQSGRSSCATIDSFILLPML